MQHGTRKRPGRALACALAFGLATALALPGGSALALAGVGTVGGVGGDGDGDIERVDEPFGQIVRIIPDAGTLSILFLPALPILDEEGRLPGSLETLAIERAYADEPDAWEPLGTLAWDDGWGEYNTPDGSLSLVPVYADDQWTIVSYCTVHVESDAVDYRDFYLRATAVTREDGVRTTTAFVPALFAYEEEWLPDPQPDPDDSDGPNGPGAEPPSIVNPPEAGSGDSGGNRGGVGQGESERVDPASTAEDVASAAQEAETAPRRGAPSAGQDATESGNGGEGGADAEGGASGEASADEGTTGPAAQGGTAASSAAPAGAGAAEADGEGRVPGFVWAVGVTTGAVAVAGGALAARRGRSERPRKTRP